MQNVSNVLKSSQMKPSSYICHTYYYLVKFIIDSKQMIMILGCQSADIVFVLDSSSLDTTNWSLLLQYVELVAYTISTRYSGNRFGIVRFSENGEVVYAFNRYRQVVYIMWAAILKSHNCCVIVMTSLYFFTEEHNTCPLVLKIR